MIIQFHHLVVDFYQNWLKCRSQSHYSNPQHRHRQTTPAHSIIVVTLTEQALGSNRWLSASARSRMRVRRWSPRYSCVLSYVAAKTNHTSKPTSEAWLFSSSSLLLTFNFHLTHNLFKTICLNFSKIQSECPLSLILNSAPSFVIPSQLSLINFVIFRPIHSFQAMILATTNLLY